MRSMTGEPDSLPAALLEQFPELGAMRVRRGGVLPRLGGWCLGQATVAGITVGRTVWLGRNVVPSAELLLHELRHVHQFESVRAFALRYVWESLRRGYHSNRFEVEARQFAVERTRPPREVPFTEGV
ncbi:MAG TPA: hypothetical protein PKC83_07705 [Gemmatimonadaceae bacterium]|nr:hypothetical protein [Gemmatimonadaceae bacterium]